MAGVLQTAPLRHPPLDLLNQQALSPIPASALWRPNHLSAFSQFFEHYKPSESLQRQPAWHLLSMLGLKNPKRPQGGKIVGERPIEGGLIRRVLRSREIRLENHLSTLGDELGTTDLFDLLYDAQDRLVAIFPVMAEARAGTEAESIYYFDLSPYYVELPALGDTNPARWQGLKESMRSDANLIGRYLSAHSLSESMRSLGTVGRIGEGHAPSLYPSYIEAPLSSHAPVERSPLSSKWVHQDRHAVLPLFPTVYSPGDRFHRMEDSPYFEYLYPYSRPSKPPFEIQKGHSVLVAGCGSGLEVLLVARLTGQRVYAFDRNPFAVAATRAMAAAYGIDVEVKVFDNIVSATGEGVFGKRKYDRIIWGMPAYTPSKERRGVRRRQKDYWDNDLDGKTLILFSGGLRTSLFPGGEAMIWNSLDAEVGQILTAQGLDWVQKILPTPEGMFGTGSGLYFLKPVSASRQVNPRYPGWPDLDPEAVRSFDRDVVKLNGLIVKDLSKEAAEVVPGLVAFAAWKPGTEDLSGTAYFRVGPVLVADNTLRLPSDIHARILENLIITSPESLRFAEYVMPMVVAMLTQDLRGHIIEDDGVGHGLLSHIALQIAGARRVIGAEIEEDHLLQGVEELQKRDYAGVMLRPEEVTDFRVDPGDRYVYLIGDLGQWFQMSRKALAGGATQLRVANFGPYYGKHHVRHIQDILRERPRKISILGGYTSGRGLRSSKLLRLFFSLPLRQKWQIRIIDLGRVSSVLLVPVPSRLEALFGQST